MKEFLIANWYYIVLAFVAVAGFISSLIVSLKKKSGNLFDSVKEALLENIPLWAVLSESLASGEDKKNNVISLGIALASKLLGKKLDADEVNYFSSFISEHLEKILAAPQKKLAMTKKSKYNAQEDLIWQLNFLTGE